VLERMCEDRIALPFTALHFRIYKCRKECVKDFIVSIAFSALQFITVIGYHYHF